MPWEGGRSALGGWVYIEGDLHMGSAWESVHGGGVCIEGQTPLAKIWSIGGRFQFETEFLSFTTIIKLLTGKSQLSILRAEYNMTHSNNH